MARPAYCRDSFAKFVERQPHYGRTVILLNQRQAAERLEINRSTVASMLEDLEAQGRLLRWKKKGRRGQLVRLL